MKFIDFLCEAVIFCYETKQKKKQNFKILSQRLRKENYISFHFSGTFLGCVRYYTEDTENKDLLWLGTFLGYFNFCFS